MFRKPAMDLHSKELPNNNNNNNNNNDEERQQVIDELRLIPKKDAYF